MIKFQIIIEKKGVQKKIKPFLGKTMSSLALVLSVLVLSTIIGLGIHLVFAGPYSNPTADPPLENVEGPVNVSDVTQTKGGTLGVRDAFQDDPLTPDEDKNWQLTEDGYIGSMNLAVFGKAEANRVRAWDTLYSDDKIEAPNQNWEEMKPATRTTSPNSVYLSCDDGWFLHEVQLNDDDVKLSNGYCAAPFVKASSIIGGTGGGEIDDKERFKRGIGDGTFGDW